MTKQMYVEREGESHIALTGWIGPATPRKCKAVGGGRFQPKKDDRDAFWRYPLDMGVCRALRSQFGDMLTIGPALNEWARAEVAKEKRLAEQAVAGTADLQCVPVLAPFLDAATLNRTYQRVAARWGAEMGSFLLADDQGLGKSIETLATIIEAGVPNEPRAQWHLICSPSVAVDLVWTAEVRRWLQDMHCTAVGLTGSYNERQETLQRIALMEDKYEHIFVVTNIEAARIKPHYDDKPDPRTGVMVPDTRHPKYHTRDAVLPGLFDRVWDTVVVDECHRALIRTTGKMSQTRAGFEVLSKNAHRRIALSGTPMRGKPEQLWGTLHWLRPDVYTSYWNWVARYFEVGSNGFSDYVLGDFLPDGEQRLAEDLHRIMLRRTKAEVLPELPPKTYAGTYLIPTDDKSPHGIWLEPSAKQLKQWKQLADDAVLDFGDGGEVIVDGTLATYTRQKQLADAVHVLKGGRLTPTTDSPKYDWLLNFIRELDGERVVVASQFTSVIDAFAAGLNSEGIATHVLTGKTSQKNRERIVKDFQSETPSATVFLLNTKAGGVALTLDAADYVVIIDETTVPDEQVQVEDRTHRTSRIHNVTVYYLRTLGSLDEEVAWITAARGSVQQYLMDGARGVEYARKVYEQAA